MKILCLILARGGSERVPKKNIKILGDKPLITYTLECAKKSKYIDRIIVSTDSDEIARVSTDFGAEAPFRRPADISKSDSTELDAFKHALSWLKENESYVPDIIVKLFPTSPFRKAETVDRAIELLMSRPDADSVRSVRLCTEHPHKMWRIDQNGFLESFVPLDEKLPEAHTLAYHLLPEVYIQNASIDVTKPSNIWKKNSITGTKILPLVMEEYESLDINTPLDFELADYLISLSTTPLEARIIGEDLEEYARYLDFYVNECIVCGSSKTSKWAEYGSFKAIKCDRCGMIWINPMVNPDGVEKYYQDYIGMRFEDKDKTLKRKAQYEIDKDYIQQHIMSGKVLDVGCSGGFFLETLSNKFEKYGVEIDKKAVEFARENYSFGSNVRAVRLEEAPFEDATFDLVIMRGVIEHLHDPSTAIAKISSLLKKGGFFYVAATPNSLSFSADFYREKWNQFHPIRHLYYFSVETLPALCSRFGLKLLSYRLPYLETPYCSVEDDIKRVEKDIRLKSIGQVDKIGRSQAFWENMMNIVFVK
ncbi:MAG: methyltransferase domain-containing protein [Candidatus Altiarchaeota archaeon]|nr:methyltransferase domain-containing protein [Candidatus Altiarchaeota archaeon]